MPQEKQYAYPTKPIRPEDILAVKAEMLPDEAYVAVNGLIAEKMRGQYATVKKTEIIKRMVELGLERKDVIESGWDDVGAVYKRAGWHVSYHTPSEDARDYDPYYMFSSNAARIW